MGKAKTKKRPKQQYLADELAPGGHKDIDAVADAYDEIKCQRAGLSKEEKEAQDGLVEKMLEHGLSSYETPSGLIVTMLSKSKAKTKRKGDASENGEAEE
jgi:hypothetical protein